MDTDHLIILQLMFATTENIVDLFKREGVESRVCMKGVV